jgi:hypothetical protein
VNWLCSGDLLGRHVGVVVISDLSEFIILSHTLTERNNQNTTHEQTWHSKDLTDIADHLKCQNAITVIKTYTDKCTTLVILIKFAPSHTQKAPRRTPFLG